MSVWFHITCAFVGVDTKQAHAVKLKPKRGKRKTHDALCGRRVKPLAFPTVNEEGGMTGHITTPWPPYAKDAAEWGFTRCAECMVLAPGKPQRLDLVPTGKGD